ncbi:non-ribosomal peptide synthetase [Saccharopolyspora phatthalungensis]|uniref:Amino acid adenylation domain-containing protein n=1 Tax=Saccharopolyspora phatthalungensis TaxID=664693 RepID=A0A840Q8P2_9PSEU|nr:non-ribosomal peptide synthetase [Saccharopolyspora phatthalungensis]MBB5156816.1 amino acid adenylation domain-containing protein [Saccharopolyspora phatthalungensis]
MDPGATVAELAAGAVTLPTELGSPLVAFAHDSAVPDTPRAELHLAIIRQGSIWQAELRYVPGLFGAETAERMLSQLRTLVADVARDSATPVSRLSLLGPEEMERILVGFNDTVTDLPHGTCLHTWFEMQATARPDATAVVQGARSWTYTWIDRAADRLAGRLRASGVGPGDRVGLCLERSAELLAAILAILKAGAAYVPLDPDYPEQRLAAMLDGTSCAAVVTDAARTACLPGADRPTLVTNGLFDEPVEGERLDSTAGPEDLCYVIHTSGSTGAPKPIALRHRGVVNNIADLNSRFEVSPSDRVLALSSPSFDMSVYEFLGITAVGGTVIVPESEHTKDVAHWALLCARHGVTVWNSAPALLELLVDYLEHTGERAFDALRLVLLGGDWVPVSLPDRLHAFAPDARFAVMGGATEASIHSTLYEVTTTDPAWTSIPYGRPMANQRTYILDDALRPVPPGVVGELHLAGTGLARGYLDRPDLTAERFHDWSYGAVHDRLYRTGDLARYRPDGVLELIGRKDFQVKVNGLRIELGEIEAVLRSHPDIKDSVVMARSDGGRQRLVGCAVPRPGTAPEPAALRAHLAKSLPAFMVPAAVLVLDTLPLNANGKLDRKAIGALDPDRPALKSAPATTDDTPQGPWEQHIAAVWTEILNVEPVGRDSDFFALGGDSMTALRCLARIDPGLRWPELARHSTVPALAARLTTMGHTPPTPRLDRPTSDGRRPHGGASTSKE